MVKGHAGRLSKRLKNRPYKLMLSKAKLAVYFIVLATVVPLIVLLNSQQHTLTELRKHNVIESVVINSEQRIHAFISSQDESVLLSLQASLLSTHKQVLSHYQQDIPSDFQSYVLSEDAFFKTQRNLNRNATHSIVQDTLLQLFTLSQAPPEQIVTFVDAGFTLSPLLAAMQTHETALIQLTSKSRQQALLVVTFALMAYMLVRFVTWLFGKHALQKKPSTLSKSNLRVSFADKDFIHQKSFIQLLSHEFRAPISVIISALELIPNMEDQKGRLIQQAEQSSYRLLSLTNNLTELLTDNIEDDLIPQSIDLISLLDESISPFSVQLKDKKVDLQMHCSQSVPQLVESDPVAISKVVTNILDNAVKFTSTGLIDVTITTQVKQQGVFLVIIISDTGIGMDEETQKHMFDRFYRGKQATVYRYPGAGIGLSVAKRNINKLGGALTVNSSLGVGTEFKVLLPVKVLETPIVDVSSVSNATFAVVDDLEISRLHLHAIISSQGFKARTFSSGAELINLHDKVLEFTAIIADLYMPGMTGLELVKTLSAIYGKRMPPVIVLSATPDIASIISNSDLPIYQSFVKPIDKQRLIDALENVTINKSRAPMVMKKASILVVEDEPINAEMVEHMLRCMGHTVTVCYNGDDAIISANEKAFDCVLLDINLPDMNGLEVAKILRERHPQMPIIALTANAQRDDKEASRQAGIRYHLVKPVTFQELKNTLNLTI